MNSLCGLKANGPFSTKSWPGTLWKLKSGHFEPANHRFEAKGCHFEAKMKQFDAKTKHFEAKIKHFEHLDGFGGQIFQNESRIFSDEFLMRLKGKRAVFRQILAGDPLEAQICHFEPANHFVAI